jgi:hypothetical protein
MIGQYLPQTNENATVAKSKNFRELNRASQERAQSRGYYTISCQMWSVQKGAQVYTLLHKLWQKYCLLICCLLVCCIRLITSVIRMWKKEVAQSNIHQSYWTIHLIVSLFFVCVGEVSKNMCVYILHFIDRMAVHLFLSHKHICK